MLYYANQVLGGVNHTPIKPTTWNPPGPARKPDEAASFPSRSGAETHLPAQM